MHCKSPCVRGEHPRVQPKWIPVRGLANDLSWAEERSAVALANYVLHALKEAE